MFLLYSNFGGQTIENKIVLETITLKLAKIYPVVLPWFWSSLIHFVRWGG